MALMYRALKEDDYDRQYTDAQLYARIGRYFLARGRQVAGVVGAISVASLMLSLRPLVITAGVAALDAGTDWNWLTLMVLALFATVAFEYGGNYVRRRLIGRAVGGVVTQMRKDALHAALERDLAFYDTNKSGKLVSRVTGDTQEFGTIVVTASDIISQLVSLVVLVFILVFRDWRMTLLVFAFTPVVVLVAQAFRYFARVTTRNGARAVALVNDNIQETVAGIAVAKNFRREGFIYDEFVKVNQQSYNANIVRGFVLALIFPVLNALAGFATAATVYYGANWVVNGTSDAATWYLFTQAVDRFWFPFITLSAFISQFQAGLSAVERVFALIDAENVLHQTDDQPVPPLKGRIQFQHVNFGYKADEPVLRDFNLDIRPGESVAFVGHTGAGKSTVAKLITRFYEFQDGRILVDGHDIRTFNVQQYRAQLGIVSQTPFLFSGTVLENIRYSRPDATDAEIEAVARGVGGGEWLEALPRGLHTEVGERGALLSVGQRQLVSLMRVLTQRPAIFILDEATASVDPFTEAQIQEALDLILKQSTSILIAHRLSTVRSADRIIVLRQGAMIEEGSHEALLTHGGHYAELYNTYFRHQSLSYIENARSMLTGAEAVGDD